MKILEYKNVGAGLRKLSQNPIFDRQECLFINDRQECLSSYVIC